MVAAILLELKAMGIALVVVVCVFAIKEFIIWLMGKTTYPCGHF